MKLPTRLCLLLFITITSYVHGEAHTIKDNYLILNYDKSAYDNLERISRYLETKKNITGKLKCWELINNKSALFYKNTNLNIPQNEVIIGVTEVPKSHCKKIIIAMHYKLPELFKAKIFKNKLLKLVNYWMAGNKCRFRINLKQNELLFSSEIYLRPGTIVSTEIVTDLALHMMNEWPSKYNDLKKYLNIHKVNDYARHAVKKQPAISNRKE